VVPGDATHGYLPDHCAPYDLHVLAAEVEAHSSDDRLGVLADENTTVVAIVLGRYHWRHPFVQSIQIGDTVFVLILFTDILLDVMKDVISPIRIGDAVIHVHCVLLHIKDSQALLRIHATFCTVKNTWDILHC